MITLKQLRHALALECHGHFNRAAKAERISQPALSRSIRALEEQLGVPLFDRQGGSVVPTLFGAALLRHAAQALGETDELVREIELLKGLEAGQLQVAMGVYAAEMSAARSIGELVERHPGITCRIRLTSWKDLAGLVSTRSVDLGIGEISTLVEMPELDVEALGRPRLVMFCRPGHPLAGRRDLSKEELDGFPIVTPRLPPRGIGLVPGKTRVDPDTGDLLPTVEVDNLTSARLVVAGSDAFGMATPVQIADSLRSGEFRVLDYHRPWMELDYGFIYLRQRMLSPAATAYMEIVRRIDRGMCKTNDALMAEVHAGLGRG
ncbi:MAG: LysR family transcriptional regulator [Gammaproteobacteria bacterium]|jgi:DNA-binding transcriptional LysR family regulator